MEWRSQHLIVCKSLLSPAWIDLESSTRSHLNRTGSRQKLSGRQSRVREGCTRSLRARCLSTELHNEKTGSVILITGASAASRARANGQTSLRNRCFIPHEKFARADVVGAPDSLRFWLLYTPYYDLFVLFFICRSLIVKCIHPLGV
jgi:hypothetical protein